MLPLVAFACSEAAEQVDISGETMGTTYTIRLIGNDIDAAEIRDQVETTLRKINAQMSTWEPDSEISRFNRLRSNDWFRVSDEFIQVLSAAQKINRLTDGAFDITIGDVVNLWGFGSTHGNAVPDPASIAARLRHTGPEKIDVVPARKMIRKNDPDTLLDLSGIAKGYAVDALAEIVIDAGVSRFLVEIGGEVRASGRRADGALWQVAVEKPDSSGRSVYRVIGLDNAAIATSGDYRDFFEVEGKRYSHIIDPATGTPPDHGTASVSVITDAAMTADALATGFMVMGKKKALALATESSIATLIIERRGNGFDVHRSDQFELRTTNISRRQGN